MSQENFIGPGHPFYKATLRGDQAIPHLIMDEEGGMMTADRAAQRLGVKQSELEQMRQAGKILSVEAYGERRYPVWQLDDEGQLLEGVAEVTTALSHLDDWMKVSWMLGGDDFFGGNSPLNVLREAKGNPEVITSLVRRAKIAFE